MVVSKGAQVQVASTEILPAKNTGSYRGIQNLDGTNSIHVCFGGAAATSLNGIRIGPGEFLDVSVLGNGSPINAIAIGGIVNIVIAEG